MNIKKIITGAVATVVFVAGMNVICSASVSNLKLSAGSLDRAFQEDYTLYHVELPQGAAIPTITADGATVIKTATTADLSDPTKTVTVLRDNSTGREYRFVMRSKTAKVVVSEFRLSYDGVLSVKARIENGHNANLMILRPTTAYGEQSYKISDINATTMHDTVLDIVQGQLSDGVFSFNYNFHGDCEAGMYSFYIGGDGVDPKDLFVREVYYATPKDRDETMLELATFSGTQDQANELILKASKVFGFDSSDYQSLGDKSLVFSTVLDNSFATPDAVTEAFHKAVGATLISKSGASAMLDLLNEYGDYLELSIEGEFNELDNKTPVYQRLAETNVISSKQPYVDLKKAFDGIVAVYFLNQAEPYQIAKLIEDDYVKFGITESEYNKFNTKSDKQTVYAAITNKGFNSEIEVRNAFVAALEPPKTGGTGGGGTSGGGGSSSGTGSVSYSTPGISGSFTVEPELIVVPDVSPDQEKPAPQVITSVFDDIDGVEWAREAIVSLYDDGILNGVSERKFNPDANITREEFVKLLVSAIGLKIGEGETAFEDVNADEWYAPYVAALVKVDIVKGVDDGIFGVSMNITRQDMAVLMVRAATYKNAQLDIRFDQVEFQDADQFDEYAADSIETLARSGIMRGVGDGRFAPRELATRAQAAVLIFQFMKMS